VLAFEHIDIEIVLVNPFAAVLGLPATGNRGGKFPEMILRAFISWMQVSQLRGGKHELGWVSVFRQFA
jgi:hypothetical protein